MATTLRLAPDLALPLDAVTQRFAELGRIGSGKSYLATKLAELFFDAGAQFIALDPVGIWYGLRVDGKGKGLPIPIFGGLHGDVPLEATAGALMADLIVDRRLSCVLDVSQFESDADKARFAAAFVARFYFRKKGAPSAVHLFLEECQEFVPQIPQKGEERMLHEFTRMAKLGRNFGIGLSLITQRPQEVNKKVLNLTECLLAFQMTGVHERKAIRDWASTKGADEDIVAMLPTLPVGDAHLYSPQWLGLSRRVRCAEKRSADVSSTPKVDADAVVIETKPLAKGDLAALRDQMAATVEKAKAEDPKELRRRIAALEKDLAAKRGASAHLVTKPILDQATIDRAVARERDGCLANARRVDADVVRRLTRAGDAFERGAAIIGEVIGLLSPTQSDAVPPPVAATRPVPATTNRVDRPGASAATDGVSSGMQKILNALAELRALGIDQPRRAQLALFASMSLNGGSGAQNVANLVSMGLSSIPESGLVALTDAGHAAADAADTPTSRDELHDRVMRKLSTGQQKILAHLLQVYPDVISRHDLSAAVGMSLNGGSGAQNVADLVTVGAARIPAKGKVVASDLLFPEGL